MRPFDPALLRALPATRGPVALLSAAGVLSGVVAIAQAVVLAVAVGRVVGGGPLVQALGWLVGLIVLRGLLAGFSELVARGAGLRVAAIVRLAVLRRWLGRPEEERPQTEVAVTLATEGVSSVEPWVARYLPALVTAAVVPVLTLAVLVVVDPWSALIVVLTLPLLPLFAALIGLHTQEETQRRWAAMDRLAGHFLDVVRGLPTLVAYGRARHQVGVVREVGERHRAATVRTLRTAFLSTTALELLATISVAMVAVAVGLRLAYGAMDLEVGLVAILLAPEAYWPVRRLGAEFHNAADGAAVLEALKEDGVLGAARDDGRANHLGTLPPRSFPGDSARRSARLIQLAGVSYAHRGRERTLVDVTASTPSAPGLTALTGPSGAGKTTVLELLAGLRMPEAGLVQAPGAHLAAQRPVILPGTVRDNLALVGTQDEDAMVRSLDRVGLWSGLAGREGLDTVLGDDGFGLSAGQRARLALARAVLSDTPLVLLDEPTANVAAASVPLLHEVIVDLARQRRVIVVTHDPFLAALADDRWELPALEHDHVPAEPHESSPRPGTATGVGDRRDTDRDRGPGLLSAPRGRRGLALACLIGGASVACGVALTATSGWLIVQASTMPVVLTLMVAIVGVRAFGLFRPVFRYAERVLSHDVALEDLAWRRAEVFAGLVPLTPARLGRRSRGEVLTTVVRDLDDVVDEQVRVTVPAWSTALATVVGVVLAWWHLPAAGAAVAGGALLLLVLAATGYAVERGAQQSAVEARGRVQHRVTALTGRLLPVQAVTGLAADPGRLLAGVEEAERQQLVAEGRLIRSRAALIALTWAVVAATTAAVGLSAWQAQQAGILSGPYAALVALVPMALADSWADVPAIAGARARARAAAARLEAVLGQPPAVHGHGTGTPAATAVPALHLDGVGASWTDDAALDLAPLDLDLPPGSRVALTGPNGAGKSTALAVLARHLDPARGTYAVDGDDATGLDLDRLRARIAVVDDEPHAFAGSVRANLLLARPDATDGQIVQALCTVDLAHWYSTLPEGLDTLLTGLSGGERARLSLARAVLSQRPVVLLDEPAAHLDDATAERALDGLLDADPSGARSHVLVSHRTAGLASWDTVDLGEPAPLGGATMEPETQRRRVESIAARA